MSEPDFFPTFRCYVPNDFLFKIAGCPEELEAFWRLRMRIFCEEQNIFQDTDRDEFDDNMIPIICTALVMGMEDQVVGVVRIDEREPGIWHGSRLGVHPGFRRIGSISPGVSQRNGQPSYFGQHSVGAGLIYKAVSTATALGCTRFLALVQEQNSRFFERLHWLPLEKIELYGLPHVRMQADLSYYPPATEDLPRRTDVGTLDPLSYGDHRIPQ